MRSQGRPKTKEKGNETMKTIVKITTYPAFALFAFACFALSPTAKAQVAQPAPDGGATVTSTDVAEPAAPLVTPIKTVFNYNLAPGANSVTHTVPNNVPVLVMGVCTTLNYRGAGQVTLLHIPGSFIEWTGLESPSGFGCSTTCGYSGSAGHHIVYIDYAHQVDIQVAGPDTIRVHNGSGAVRTGNVTLIW
jgi:hypothetical protein